LSFEEQEKIRKIFVDHFRRAESTKPRRQNETEILFSDRASASLGNGADVVATVPLIRPEFGTTPEEETSTRFDDLFDVLTCCLSEMNKIKF
jgi:hypothetical protein